jgi:hypothetical protein
LISRRLSVCGAQQKSYIQTEYKTENTHLRCGDRRAGGCFCAFGEETHKNKINTAKNTKTQEKNCRRCRIWKTWAEIAADKDKKTGGRMKQRGKII